MQNSIQHSAASMPFHKLSHKLSASDMARLGLPHEGVWFWKQQPMLDAWRLSNTWTDDAWRLSNTCTDASDASRLSNTCTDASRLMDTCTDTSRLSNTCTDASRLSNPCTDASRLSNTLIDEDTLRLSSILKDKGTWDDNGSSFPVARDLVKPDGKTVKVYGLFTSPAAFYHCLLRIPDQSRCYYELIPEGSPCRLHADIEWIGQSCDGHAKISLFLDEFRPWLRRIYPNFTPEIHVLC